VTEKAFGHLATSRVAGAEDEDGLFHGKFLCDVSWG
jgi:hypothetical protein